MKATMSDKAIEMFANMLATKLESVSTNWQKPWFTKGELVLPTNFDKREYKGANILLLMLVAQNKGYKSNVWLTFNRVNKLAKELKKNLHVLKGEKATPVSLTDIVVRHKDTGAKISYNDYLVLSVKEREEYKTIPFYRDYFVFNVCQTNLEEVAPEVFAKCVAKKEEENISNNYCLEAADNMLEANSWICPINQIYQDSAFYSVTNNSITLPMKAQFAKGEEFYSTMFHEMTHSTYKELKREIGGKFGSYSYGKEELVAELTSLLVCTTYGIEKVTKEESCKYLKGWLKAIKEDSDFLMSVLNDTKKAYNFIVKRIQSKSEVVVAA